MNKKRIVSLLPGATEWVCELGLADQLVGVSHECDFPAIVSSLPKVTRSRIDVNSTSTEIDQAVRSHSESRTPLFDLDATSLLTLEPDLILTQTLCNVCAVNESSVRDCVKQLASPCELIDLRATTFDSVLDDARQIIQATDQRSASNRALCELMARVDRVRDDSAHTKRPRMVLLEWTDPLFCAGHWTPELISWAGGTDPIGKAGQPSRQIETEELFAADPEILLIACCGLDQHRCQIEWQELKSRMDVRSLSCVQNEQVHIFDGSAWFNRPGPRLVDALEAVSALINPVRR